jgi:hypothetical protein
MIEGIHHSHARQAPNYRAPDQRSTCGAPRSAARRRQRSAPAAAGHAPSRIDHRPPCQCCADRWRYRPGREPPHICRGMRLVRRGRRDRRRRAVELPRSLLVGQSDFALTHSRTTRNGAPTEHPRSPARHRQCPPSTASRAHPPDATNIGHVSGRLCVDRWRHRPVPPPIGATHAQSVDRVRPGRPPSSRSRLRRSPHQHPLRRCHEPITRQPRRVPLLNPFRRARPSTQ